ncbi:type II toxin-antitoxin system RelE/ParE family toxin [Sphingobium wenxiniae]|uniref:Proteic killer suppression protein n=1 Tax=Sphingobium wenxiniae (strain DSM 21828 / CGMCC 1.7748 / JZ-1) TaxID=595605 RepID=A0A562KIR1_SPHWJ|nr:type II toxin-antitoxin system RelE/ParE family toxin [Sphingobium wenxiniae]TWH95272.1 proteic killer suppression protein [Sphingobium wenxiniae]
MEIESINHKALRSLYLEGKEKGLIEPLRLKKMLSFITLAASLDELQVPPNYKLHQLTGDRAGTWSMWVTRNWRMTFQINDDGAIIEMDLEDYHGS